MGVFNWIFGKHPPRPPDPSRSTSAALLPRWQAELALAELAEHRIHAVISDDHTSYLGSGRIESMAHVYVMEPDRDAAKAIIDEITDAPEPDWQIRPATSDDETFLRQMQYEAMFTPFGADPFPQTVVDQPGIARYHVRFGTRDGDVGWIAETTDGEPIGAAWARRFPRDEAGYGFVDERTPELAIALAEHHRGSGIGTALLQQLLADIGRCSLSVDHRNPAVALYERVGFRTLSTEGDSITMIHG